MMWILFAWLFACQSPPSKVIWSASPSGVEAHGANGLSAIEIRDTNGRVIAREQSLEAQTRVWLPVDWSQHQTVWAWSHGQLDGPVAVVRPATMDTVRISLPLGQDRQAPPKDKVLRYPALVGAQLSVGVSMVAMSTETIRIAFADGVHEFSTPYPGQRINVVGDAVGGESIKIEIGDATWEGTLSPVELSLEEAAADVRIESVRFPTDIHGAPDVARPRGKISLPAPWWTAFMSTMGWGFRARDRTVPWGHMAVAVRNSGPSPMNLVARARVANSTGPDPAFRPTMRDVDDGTGWVSVALRAPEDALSVVTLPLYMDEVQLHDQAVDASARKLEVHLSPTGSTETIAEHSSTLFVNRSSTPANIGFGLGILGAIGGLWLIVSRLRYWLAMDTTTLVTISLFATLSFVVNAAIQVFGFGVAGILGPFAFLLTGLLDDTVRACLLVTLLLLRPRPGVCALSVIVGWLLRSVVLGSASPTDLLYLTGHVFFLEGSMWLFGLTRGKPLGLGRLSLAFACTYSLTILAALAFNVFLYRLFYADWYVALSVAMNGFVYPVIACAIAIPFANTLRRVED